jgi:hypothetical protein
MLNINFINDLTLKTIHDLLMDCETEELTLQEELDFAVDLDYLFELAHYLKELNPNLVITYKTEREYYPFDFISTEMQLREIPFDYIDLNGNICKNLDSSFL